MKPFAPGCWLVAAVAGALPGEAQTMVVDMGRGSIGDYVVVRRSNEPVERL